MPPPPSPQAAPVPPPTPRELTSRALHVLELKQYDDAIVALRSAANADPLIAPYLHLRVADAQEALGRIPDAIATATSIIAEAPASSAATIAAIRLPGLYAAAADVPNMDAALQQIAAVGVDDLDEADFVSLASRLEKCGFADRANVVRMRILTENTDGRSTEQVYSAIASATRSSLDSLPTEEATKLAQSLARADRYDQALDLLRRIAARPDAPASTLYRNVRLHALYNSRNYRQLLGETQNVQLDAPLLLMRARAAWRLNDDPQFLAGLSRVETEFPKSREAIDAKVLRAKYYVSDEIDFAKSVDNVQQAISAGVLGTDGDNLWTLGYTYVMWGKYDDALRTFDDYLRRYPDGAYNANALFWSGKVQEKLGNKDARDAAWSQLIARWPFDYYAYRAKELGGGQAPTPVRTGEAPVLHFPDVDAELAKVSDPRIDAVRELDAVGLALDATREMKSVAAANRDNVGIEFMLAEVYVKSGEPFEAIEIVQRYFRDF
ncbi:MAG TPA: tetratricopeptide repeat protein, partial [Thermoanaerobaculia bacterium]|nr:tetratricopeptide repeat protein [Thermoanaerobaculia bacterium]